MVTRSALLSILAAACLVVSGCSTSSPGAPTPNPSLSAGASLTPVPGDSNPASPPSSAEPPTQTDTEWGRIWDALPASFPLPPDAVPTETGEGPASASLAVGASASKAADLVVAGLTQRGYKIDARSGPSEDGSVVIDALGAAPACKVQVRLTPLSGTTHMVVMFGAGCPFE